MEMFGIRLVGMNAETGHKLLLTIGFIVGILLVRAGIVGIAHVVTGRHRNERVMFWTRQGASVTAALLTIVALLSIWFDDPQRLTAVSTALNGAEGVLSVAAFGSSLHVAGQDAVALDRAIAPHRAGDGLRWARAEANLEDVFISVVEQARQQGIHIEHINSFMERIMGDTPMPRQVRQLLENWRTGPSATVSIESLLVLRTSAPETLDYILDTPALRRYLGARLGPMAVIVRADQWEALRDALGEQGMQVEIVGE